ncbi:hypothetical protein NA57DRAFT_52978 [Rhizodiscina lignyota]|uniref:Ribosomal protein mS38 C-terminal domain-containing protein n=1 Tax=Rhizodiscina lignyota TaxID=1504668 RepID=A0A9P4IKZ4_9PEZI|nr:hypothetical protein NA57DRAFT_52978 [Rhizodiscina lignyota]
MISSSLGRFIRATWPATSPAVASSTCPAAARAAAATTRPLSNNPRTHQRRHSSSKTSRSPDGIKVVRGSLPSQQHGQQEQKGLVQRGRIIAKRSKSRAEETLPDLPSVPSTQDVDYHDVALSCFFSQHRPISVTTGLPLPSQSFDRLFDPQQDSAELTKQRNLSSQMRLALQTFDNLSSLSQGHGSQALQSVGSNSGAVHLDGAPFQYPALNEQTVNQHLARRIPFQPPPRPEPGTLGSAQQARKLPAQSTTQEQSNSLHSTLLPAQSKKKSFRATIKRKSWSTTIIVTEITNAHGYKQYAATNTPIVQIPTPSRMRTYPSTVIEEPESSTEMEDVGLSRETIKWKQPFMQRMWLRQQESLQRRQEKENDMLLISVKRQRKLKMKKHKYKKLMRRTRNLRRRLGKD